MLEVRFCDSRLEPPPGLGRWRVVVADRGGNPYAYGKRADSGEHWLRVPNVGTFRFEPSSQTVYASREGDDWGVVLDAYYRTVLPIALQVAGFEALHASSVLARPFGVVALCGYSGSGKSTLAYALAKRGHEPWGDDALVFEPAPGGGVRSVAIPFRIGLRHSAGRHFGLAGAWRSALRHPAPTDADETRPPLAAVFVLDRRNDRDARTPVEVCSIPSADAVHVLLAHSYRFGFGDSRRKEVMFRNFLALAAGTPVFRLEFVPRLDDLSRLVDQVEQRLGTQASYAT